MPNYQIILTKNNQKFRLVSTYVKKQTAISRFDNLIKENEKVKFEKKINNFNPVIFNLELLTNKDERGVIKHERDEFGRNTIIEPINGWYKLKKEEFKIPEIFPIYGYPDRYEYSDLINFFDSFGSTTISMSRIFNTLILEPENNFPLLITLKTEPECKRLYDTIISEKLPTILAFGHMDITNRKMFYKKMKKIRIPISMFYRKTTR